MWAGGLTGIRVWVASLAFLALLGIATIYLVVLLAIILLLLLVALWSALAHYIREVARRLSDRDVCFVRGGSVLAFLRAREELGPHLQILKEKQIVNFSII